MRRFSFSTTLLGVVVACAGAGAPGLAQAAPTTGGATAGTASLISTQTFEQRLLARTNHRRALHGCRALRSNTSLVTAARLHSARMSIQSDLSHRLGGEPDLVGRAVSAGYTPWRMLAENLAWGQSTPRAMFRAWVASPAHRANLDNCRLRDVGIGVVFRDGRPWATSDFGRH
jgi:uncharacterized protein YkwD